MDGMKHVGAGSGGDVWTVKKQKKRTQFPKNKSFVVLGSLYKKIMEPFIPNI